MFGQTHIIQYHVGYIQVYVDVWWLLLWVVTIFHCPILWITSSHSEMSKKTTRPPHRELRHSSSEPTWRQVSRWMWNSTVFTEFSPTYLKSLWIIMIHYVSGLFTQFYQVIPRVAFSQSPQTWVKFNIKLYQSVLRNGSQLREVWKDMKLDVDSKTKMANEAGDKPCEFCAATES